MKIKVGIAQIPNSTDIDLNFKTILRMLEYFKATEVDIVLFPECSLSGFSSQMTAESLKSIAGYLDQIQSWADGTGIEVVLPTALAVNGQVYNACQWFNRNERLTYYKVGLTESEMSFFSVPAIPGSKVFEVRGFRFAILICFEAEHPAWTYISKGEADAILWPGYWGWNLESRWTQEKQSGRPNLIYLNMAEWKIPLLQSTFAFNNLSGFSGSGPEGLSFIVNSDNALYAMGSHKQVGGLVVTLEKIQGKTVVKSTENIPSLFSV